MRNPGTLVSIVKCKCPQCREGDLFKYGAVSTRFSEMHANCPVCGLHYEIETGFFWGAMYISYAFSVAIIVAAALGARIFIEHPTVLQYMSVVIPAVLIFSPISLRYSRVLMLYLFGGVKYRGNKQA